MGRKGSRELGGSVERPGTPWPMVQPSARTPPVPIKAPPPRWRSRSLVWVNPSKRKELVAVAAMKEPPTTPAKDAMPKLIDAPVNAITYIRLSPKGATNVNEAGGVGAKGAAPTTPVST